MIYKKCKCGCNYDVSCGQDFVKYHDSDFYQSFPQSKKCTRCKLEKPKYEFVITLYQHKKLIIKSYCKECQREYNRNNTNKYDRKQYKDCKRGDLKSHISERIANYYQEDSQSDLTTEYLIDLYDKQNGKCYYTNEPMIIGHRGGKTLKENMSLDKLSPIKGYWKNNVVWCTYLANTVKQNLNENEFYNICLTILKHKGEI